MELTEGEGLDIHYNTFYSIFKMDIEYGIHRRITRLEGLFEIDSEQRTELMNIYKKLITWRNELELITDEKIDERRDYLNSAIEMTRDVMSRHGLGGR